MRILAKKIALRFRIGSQRLRAFFRQKRLMAASMSSVSFKQLPPRLPGLTDSGASAILQTRLCGTH
jgi:hypothetical protein